MTKNIGRNTAKICLVVVGCFIVRGHNWCGCVEFNFQLNNNNFFYYYF